MRHLSPVVWSEGMYLSPHHFQLQSRYAEDSIRFAATALCFAPYGLAGCELDGEALRNGTVSLIHARGLFPDGLPFHMPEYDMLPPARHLADEFPPTSERLTVLLAVPARKPDGVNCIAEESEPLPSSRYVTDTVRMFDETTGRDEKPVRVGRKNIRFLLETEPADGLNTLPLARVMRDGSGHFVFDPHFVPPCVQMAASRRLMDLTGRLIEILGAKSAALSRDKQVRGRSLADYSTREVANFWMLHTVHSALAPLQHLFLSKHGHPEELYVELARLGGALCTFANDSHPRTLPLYDHDRLDDCFDALDFHIRRHLETMVPTNCISIPLAPAGDYQFAGEVTDPRCLGPSRWLLAVQSSAGEAEVISKTPQLAKLCSRAFVPELVRRALPGMALAHVQVPPAAVPARVDTQYFSITRGGPCWDHIVKTREVALYLPGEVPDPTVELHVILES